MLVTILAGECCNMTTCSLSSPSTPCREAHGSCDLPEKCDGISTQCPQDNIKPNWESCNDKGYAVCFYGECKSHSSQCADIWGDDSYSAHDLCYNLNDAGELYELLVSLMVRWG